MNFIFIFLLQHSKEAIEQSVFNCKLSLRSITCYFVFISFLLRHLFCLFLYFFDALYACNRLFDSQYYFCPYQLKRSWSDLNEQDCSSSEFNRYSGERIVSIWKIWFSSMKMEVSMQKWITTFSSRFWDLGRRFYFFNFSTEPSTKMGGSETFSRTIASSRLWCCLIIQITPEAVQEFGEKKQSGNTVSAP